MKIWIRIAVFFVGLGIVVGAMLIGGLFRENDASFISGIIAMAMGSILFLVMAADYMWGIMLFSTTKDTVMDTVIIPADVAFFAFVWGVTPKSASAFVVPFVCLSSLFMVLVALRILDDAMHARHTERNANLPG